VWRNTMLRDHFLGNLELYIIGKTTLRCLVFEDVDDKILDLFRSAGLHPIIRNVTSLTITYNKRFVPCVSSANSLLEYFILHKVQLTHLELHGIDMSPTFQVSASFPLLTTFICDHSNYDCTGLVIAIPLEHVFAQLRCVNVKLAVGAPGETLYELTNAISSPHLEYLLVSHKSVQGPVKPTILYDANDTTHAGPLLKLTFCAHQDHPEFLKILRTHKIAHGLAHVLLDWTFLHEANAVLLADNNKTTLRAVQVRDMLGAPWKPALKVLLSQFPNLEVFVLEKSTMAGEDVEELLSAEGVVVPHLVLCGLFHLPLNAIRKIAARVTLTRLEVKYCGTNHTDQYAWHDEEKLVTDIAAKCPHVLFAIKFNRYPMYLVH
jgi:hypothetical protein